MKMKEVRKASFVDYIISGMTPGDIYLSLVQQLAM
jgi:hypothetical protein